MKNTFLKQYLAEESKNLVLGVDTFRNFEDGFNSSVYAGDYNQSLNSTSIDYFLYLTRDIKNWLGVVLALDMLENRKDRASAVIYLPAQNIEVIVGRDVKTVGRKRLRYDKALWDKQYEEIARQHRDTPYFEKHMEDAIKTPVGIMDDFVLDVLSGVDINPIRNAYELFISLNARIHKLLAEQFAAEDTVLTDELLAQYHIYDVLGVHKFDLMYESIKKFLNIKG